MDERIARGERVLRVGGEESVGAEVQSDIFIVVEHIICDHDVRTVTEGRLAL